MRWQESTASTASWSTRPVSRLQQVRTDRARALERPLVAPGGDRTMIALPQDLRCLVPAELSRPGVVRVLQQTVLERLLDGRLGVAEHAG